MVGKNFNLLRWYNFFYDFRPYEAIAILYYVQVTDSYSLALAVFSIASISAAIFEVPTGVISDKVGRRRTIILGSIFSVLALSFYAFANTFFFLIIGAIFNGITRAFLSGNNDALLYDTLKEQNKTDDFSEKHGKVNSMFEVGLGISAILGGLLAIISLKLVMIVSILPQVICALLSYKFIEPKISSDKFSENIFSHLKEAIHSFLKNAKLRSLSLADILDEGLSEVAYQFKPAFNAMLWPIWSLGIIRAFDNIFGFIGYHFAGKIIKKFGNFKTLLYQQILSSGGSVLFVGFPNIVSPFILSLNGLFFGVGSTASQSVFQEEFSDKQRATMGSLNSLAGSLCFALIAFIIGLVADNLGVVKSLLLIYIATIPIIFIYWRLLRNHHKDK